MEYYMNTTITPKLSIHDMSMPRLLLSAVMKDTVIKHNTPVEVLTKKTNLKTYLRGNAIFSSNGTTVTAIFDRGFSHRTGTPLGVSYYSIENGRLIHDYVSASEALRRIPAGKHFLVPMQSTGHREVKQPSSSKSVTAILEYVNRVYGQMLHVRAQSVYNYAREVYWDLDPRNASDVKYTADKVRLVIDTGITKKHAYEWVSSINNRRYGYSGYNIEEEEEAFVRECSAPLGTAKFARSLLGMLDTQKNYIQSRV